MPYIQLEGQQYPLVAGDNAIGSDAGARVRLEGQNIEGATVVLRVGADGTVIRRAGARAVTVNGVQLGAEPTPLLHGDKIEIAGRELTFGDDSQVGNTRYVPSVRLAEGGAAGGSAAPHRAAAATGGRLVSLVDGREYAVPSTGLVIGRDPTCDVVVPSSEVSRKHAVLAPTLDGYVLTDTSTNGVWVNGERVSDSRVLGRGDVLKLADEEFRFHGDAAAAPAARPMLATLHVVSSGVMRGTSYEIHTPLAHVGRGAHNDVVLADESVSDTHAKLQRRENGWVVVDMGSTNGTYVGGRRIQGEEPIVGAPDVRFGGVKLIFRAAEEEGPAEASQTRAIAALKVDPKQRSRVASAPSATPTPQSVAPVASVNSNATSPDEARGIPIALWIVVLAAVGAGVLYFSMGR